jgi:hypothetical protein
LFELGFKKIEKKLSVCAQERVLARLNEQGDGGDAVLRHWAMLGEDQRQVAAHYPAESQAGIPF